MTAREMKIARMANREREIAQVMPRVTEDAVTLMQMLSQKIAVLSTEPTPTWQIVGELEHMASALRDLLGLNG